MTSQHVTEPTGSPRLVSRLTLRTLWADAEVAADLCLNPRFKRAWLRVVDALDALELLLAEEDRQDADGSCCGTTSDAAHREPEKPVRLENVIGYFDAEADREQENREWVEGMKQDAGPDGALT